MTYTKLITATAVLGTVALAASAEAQSHRSAARGGAQQSAPVARSQSGGGGQAVQRVGPPPRVSAAHGGVPYYGYRSYYRPYYYRPGFSLGIGIGYPYGFYGYPYGYPYGYSAYGYYGYPYGYAPGYVVAGRPYGSVRITEAPEDAEVYADGYYVGIVDDFDGVLQHLDLEPGPHRIEVRAQGHPPMAFDVRVMPGETITYRAALRQ